MHPQVGKRLPQLILWNTALRLGLGYTPAHSKHNQAVHPVSRAALVATTLQRRNLGSMSTLKTVSKKRNAKSADTTVDERASNINYLQRKKKNLCIANSVQHISQVEFGVVSCPTA